MRRIVYLLAIQVFVNVPLIAMDQSLAFSDCGSWVYLHDQLTFRDLPDKKIILHRDDSILDQFSHISDKYCLLEKIDGTYKQIGCCRMHKKTVGALEHNTVVALSFHPNIEIVATAKSHGHLKLNTVDRSHLEWADRPMTQRERLILGAFSLWTLIFWATTKHIFVRAEP